MRCARRRSLFRGVVIRELIANALIHQDMAVGGASVMVEIYSNRVENLESGRSDRAA